MGRRASWASTSHPPRSAGSSRAPASAIRTANALKAPTKSGPIRSAVTRPSRGVGEWVGPLRTVRPDRHAAEEARRDVGDGLLVVHPEGFGECVEIGLRGPHFVRDRRMTNPAACHLLPFLRHAPMAALMGVSSDAFASPLAGLVPSTRPRRELRPSLDASGELIEIFLCTILCRSSQRQSGDLDGGLDVFRHRGRDGQGAGVNLGKEFFELTPLFGGEFAGHGRCLVSGRGFPS